MGRKRIEPNFENASMEELAFAMKCAPTQKASLRMRAIWSMGHGFDREQIAVFCTVKMEAILDWINRFNDQGIDGLVDKPRSGARRKISKESVRNEVLPLLDNPSSAGHEHWTAVKLHGHLTRELSHEVSYPSLVRVSA